MFECVSLVCKITNLDDLLLVESCANENLLKAIPLAVIVRFLIKFLLFIPLNE